LTQIYGKKVIKKMLVLRRYPYRIKDHLGRELCGQCKQLLPASPEAVELHFILHQLESINEHLEWFKIFIERVVKTLAQQQQYG
jgi:hypothetical protein